MKRLIVFPALAVLFFSVPAFSQEKSAVRPDFTEKSLAGQRILIVRPSVWVGEQSTGGMAEPNADWTAQSRTLLADELARRHGGFRVEVVNESDALAGDASFLADYGALFESVATSVVNYQFFKGNRLPTRKNHPFEWTLGPSGKKLAERTGAKYALFITVKDEFGSFGRKMFQVLAAGLVGVGVQSGVHRGYAGLVDLESGNLLWLNADNAMGGDVRVADGMVKRVDQLLEGFPGLVNRPKPSKP